MGLEVRLLHPHFAPWRIERAIRAIGPYPSLDRALSDPAGSDVLELRAELEAVRVRDDDWFFTVLAPGLDGLSRRPSPTRAARAA